MAAPLKTLLTKDWLRASASEKSYARGVDISQDEWAVRIFESTVAKLRAEVMGTRFYVVTFEAARGRLKPACTCPAFDTYEGACKHIVAAGLHALKVKFRKEPKTMAGVIWKCVLTMDAGALRELAFAALLNDEDFRNEAADDDDQLAAEEERRERWRE